MILLICIMSCQNSRFFKKPIAIVFQPTSVRCLSEIFYSTKQKCKKNKFTCKKVFDTTLCIEWSIGHQSVRSIQIEEILKKSKSVEIKSFY